MFIFCCCCFFGSLWYFPFLEQDIQIGWTRNTFIDIFTVLFSFSLHFVHITSKCHVLLPLIFSFVMILGISFSFVYFLSFLFKSATAVFVFKSIEENLFLLLISLKRIFHLFFFTRLNIFCTLFVLCIVFNRMEQRKWI